MWADRGAGLCSLALVSRLLPQMTLEEKQAQTINWAPGDCCGPAQIKETFAGPSAVLFLRQNARCTRRSVLAN